MPDRLQKRLEQIAADSGAESFAVAFRDLSSGEAGFSWQGEVPFHAASTIKLALLFALFKAIEAGKAALDDRLHVRNRFFSAAPDHAPFQLDASRDGDAEVYRRVGRTMPVGELAKWMIITSSNLATNLLLEYVGLEYARGELAGFRGIWLRRGVEDHAAFDAGINNEVTADGLAALLLAIANAENIRVQNRQAILDILFAQKFNDMIPRGMPGSARVAHKTGEISSACHDAGIVFPEDGEPYVLAILTKSQSSPDARREAVAKMAHAIHHRFRR